MTRAPVAQERSIKTATGKTNKGNGMEKYEMEKEIDLLGQKLEDLRGSL